LSGNAEHGSDNRAGGVGGDRVGYWQVMKRIVVKKSLAVLASGAALFLTLGGGCNNEGNNEEDRPGVEQEQDQEQEQEGEEGGDN
jgi:hypothetical protein